MHVTSFVCCKGIAAAVNSKHSTHGRVNQPPEHGERTAAVQALVRHMYVAKPPRNRKPSRSGASSCSPAQTSDTFLPDDAARVSSTVAGYAFAAPVRAGSGRSEFARMLGGVAMAAPQNVAAHVYRCCLIRILVVA